MTTEKQEKQEKTDIKGVNDILKLMNRVNESFAYEVWIPSLGKNIMFRELNTSQQKRLIKSVIDSPIYNTEFIFAITQIIKENCVDDINADELTVLDKLLICLKMRSISINDTYEMTFKSMGKEFKRGISIDGLYEKARKEIDPKVVEPQIFSNDVYDIECSLPTIKTEYALEKELRAFQTGSQMDRTPENLRKVIGEMFINELLRHINSITIKTGEEEDVKIDFTDEVTYANRISIIEQLPVKLLDKVLNYIRTVKAEIEKVQVIEAEFKVGEKTEKVKEVLSIDGNFFINS